MWVARQSTVDADVCFLFLWLKFLWLALRTTSTAPRRRVKGPNWMKKTWKALSRWGEKSICAQLVFHRVCGLLMFVDVCWCLLMFMMFVVYCCFLNCGHHFSAAMWTAPDKQLLQLQFGLCSTCSDCPDNLLFPNYVPCSLATGPSRWSLTLNSAWAGDEPHSGHVQKWGWTDSFAGQRCYEQDTLGDHGYLLFAVCIDIYVLIFICKLSLICVEK